MSYTETDGGSILKLPSCEKIRMVSKNTAPSVSAYFSVSFHSAGFFFYCTSPKLLSLNGFQEQQAFFYWINSAYNV